jgi:hypothetical protein
MAGPYSIGVAFEGTGTDSTKTAGTVWYFGATMSAADIATTNYAWVGGPSSNAGMVERDRMVISTDVNPYTCDIADSAFEFALHYSDSAAQAFIYHPSSTNLYLAGGATSGTNLSPTGTTLFLANSDDGTESTAQAGNVVWIADEAILLGTHNGSGEYNSCTRGYYGTTGTFHSEKEIVYLSNPRHTPRQAKLLLFDHSDDSLTTRWTGYVVEAPKTSRDGRQILISCTGLLSLMREAVVNRGAEPLSPVAWVAPATVSGDVVMKGYILHKGRKRKKRVAKSGDTAHKQGYQFGNVLAFGDYSDTGIGNDKATEFTRNSSTGTIAAESGDVIRTDDWERFPVFEVFAVVRELDQEGDTDLLTDANKYSPTRDLTFPFHPLEISLALMTSTKRTDVSTSTTSWDCLGGAWGLGIPAGWIDTSAVSAVVAATAEKRIDRLVLGWNGEPVRVWEVIKQKLLKPWGLFPGTTSTGQITFGRFKEGNVEDWVGATALTLIPDTLEWLPSEPVDVITGQYGGTPWKEGEPFDVFAEDYSTGESLDSLRAGLFADRNTISVDMTTRTDREALLNELIAKIFALHFDMPRIRVKVSGGSYDIGDYFTISTPSLGKYPENNGWFVDSSGSMTSTTSSVFSFLGLLVGRSHDILSDTFDLELLLTNYRINQVPRLRAPSGVVASFSSGSKTITLDASAFSSSDAATFAVDMVIVIRKPDLSFRNTSSDVATITNISSNTLTVDTWFSVDPVANDHVELARLSTAAGYPEDGTTQPYLGGTTCEYTFIGDGGSVGALGNDAHTYGSE